MVHIAGEVMIDAPVEEVFDLVADERNEPSYNPRVVRAQKVSEGPVGAGARFVAEPRGMGPRGSMQVEIRDYVRPHRLHNVIRSSYMLVEGTLSFQDVGHGTRLTWDWDMSLVGPMRALSPVLAVVGPRWERRNWVGLKHYLESETPLTDRRWRAAAAVPISTLGWRSVSPSGSRCPRTPSPVGS